MNKLLRSFSVLAAAAALLPSLANAGSKSIYGDDNRLDYFEAPPAMRQLADSVVSLWPSKQVIKFGADEYGLATTGFGDALNLCPGEKFREQPIGAFCSGTLVGEDIVMTAGHCITDEAMCADTRFVFGFNIDKEGGKAPNSVQAKDIYGCKRIIKRDLDKQASGLIGTGFAILNALLNRAGPDYALVQLDRKVEGRKPLPVNRNKDLKAGTRIFVIGHPVGLPVKVAGEAGVRDAGRKAFFTTDLDTFGGNSGSAVFNASTNKIEGILVRGGTDFVDSPAGCKVQYKVGQGEGRGEAVTKISMLQKHIPEIGSYKAAELEIRGVKLEQAPAASEELASKIRF